MKCEWNNIRIKLSFPQMILPSKSIWYWIQERCHYRIFLGKEGFYTQVFQDCSSWVWMWIIFMLEQDCHCSFCDLLSQRKFRHGQNTFLSYPRYSSLYNTKSGNKSCRTCLWDKQDICIHLLVLPFFTRFCSAKLGISFTSIVLVVRAPRWEHASIYMSLSFDSWKIQALQTLIFQQILS